MAMLARWLTSAGREERAVLRALEDLSDRKIPARAEAEGSGVSFFTLVSLRKNALLLARPGSLKKPLAKDEFLRLTLPNRDRRQVRVPVVVPNIKVPFGAKRACICGLPKGYSGVCQRKADRFSTARFSNLHIQFPALERSFRIVDISSSGVRVVLPAKADDALFQIDAEMGPARLRLGKNVKIELDGAVPRAQVGGAVGLAIRVARDGASEHYLMNLMNRLQHQELHRLQVESA